MMEQSRLISNGGDVCQVKVAEQKKRKSVNAVVLSDIHLGSNMCRSDLLKEFFSKILDKEIDAKYVILNGDIFDNYNLSRFTIDHWFILKQIIEISKIKKLIWVAGNHDGPAEKIELLTGIHSCDEFIINSGNKTFFITHGDRYDTIIKKYNKIVSCCDWFYRFLQFIDRSKTIARFVKKTTKVYSFCVRKVRERAINECNSRGFDHVICGHTHKCEEYENYTNLGCFTEKECHYAIIDDGKCEIHQYNSLGCT